MVRGVGRQIQKLASSLLDELLYLLWSVRSELVHHHYLPRFQGGSQQALHIGFEHSGGGGPFHGHGWSHPLSVKAREQRGVLALRFLGISKNARSPMGE
jgi:hypothetical protein